RAPVKSTRASGLKKPLFVWSAWPRTTAARAKSSVDAGRSASESAGFGDSGSWPALFQLFSGLSTSKARRAGARFSSASFRAGVRSRHSRPLVPLTSQPTVQASRSSPGLPRLGSGRCCLFVPTGDPFQPQLAILHVDAQQVLGQNLAAQDLR